MQLGIKHVDEYRDPEIVRMLSRRMRHLVTRPHTLMEVCGGQTHTIVRYGLDELLPECVTLIHGPGCPVCVTPVNVIDKALALAKRPEIIFCTFGDMLRVPGSAGDLQHVRATGGDVRIVYAPADAVTLARRNPDREVVFFAVGFETTAPANALAACLARDGRVDNFSLLVAHVLVPPALESILSATDCRVNGLLAAGHVCAVAGCAAYEPITRRYGVPVVVTGFEPIDILQGALMCLSQLEEGRAEVENQYARSVRPEGNVEAQRMVDRVFEVTDRPWRGLGTIPRSGLRLRGEFHDMDAERRFNIDVASVPEPEACFSGEVLKGVRKPFDCPSFGTACTPVHPIGAPMVSGEGACAAYYRYRSRQPVGRVDGAGGES